MNVGDVTPYAVLWMILGLITAALALGRLAVSRNERDVVHLRAGEEKEIPRQIALNKQLSAIDKWGKIFTASTVVVGLAVAGTYCMIAWNDPGQVPNTFFRR